MSKRRLSPRAARLSHVARHVHSEGGLCFAEVYGSEATRRQPNAHAHVTARMRRK